MIKETICLFTYKRRSQLKMFQVLQSCTRAGQAGMWIRVSTRPWIARPLLVRNSDHFSRTIRNKRQTALECDMSERNLQNHWAFILSIICTRLATKVRVRHLGRLEAHEAECLSYSSKKNIFCNVENKTGIKYSRFVRYRAVIATWSWSISQWMRWILASRGLTDS